MMEKKIRGNLRQTRWLPFQIFYRKKEEFQSRRLDDNEEEKQMESNSMCFSEFKNAIKK